ncbi:MAG: hypothetical protein C5B50_13045 [Verrucomicrobia bacterium]|nr:MAG: hypothetical protein C5B50_13045 [Verrucomicrobiota bacterium]
MKRTVRLLISLALFLAATTSSNAWFKVTYVFCDANTNGIVDTGDVPVPSVLVVVTNMSGTFSNANWTTPEGYALVGLQENVPDTYVCFLHSATLPVGTTLVMPSFNVFSITSANDVVTNAFLIENSACVGISPPPPPPPPATNMCWLTGGGTIGDVQRPPEHSFGGVVYPGCSPVAAGGGNWNDVDHRTRLHFKGLTIQVVDCGNLPGYPPGSSSPKTPFNFIDFKGEGTLKGVGGNTADYGMVTFYARCVDLGEPGKGVDQYYLRVMDANGNIQMLISSDPANPLSIAPVVIRSGNLQLHISGCGKRLKH